jgi:hypothetical protein
MKENFLARLGTAIKGNASGRMDLEMHDLKSVEAGRAVRVLATYAPLMGPPSIHDVQNWLSAKLGEFGTKVQARADTVSAFPEQNFLTFIVEHKAVRQPLLATSTMIKAGVDQFLDEDNTLWEVVKAEQGPSYLVRKDGIPVEKMLELRKPALRGGMSARKTVTLAAMDSIPSAGGGYASVDLGDLVDFYHDGLIARGRIATVNATGVHIKTSNGTYTVVAEAITNVVEKGPTAAKQQDDAMRRFYSHQYPGNPEMTKIISPTSSLPIKDAQDFNIEPLVRSASTKIGASLHPTERVLGKKLGTQGHKALGVVSGKGLLKR